MNERKYPHKPIARDMSDNLGKLPPQVPELEEAILGAAMLETEALMTVADLLRPEDFYIEQNRIIWEAIISLFKNDSPIDMRTVTNQLRTAGKLDLIGGAFRVAELTSKIASAANIEYHARIVLEASIKRTLIQEASKIHVDAYDDGTDVFDLLDSIQGRLDLISNSYFKGGAVSAGEVYKETLKHIHESRNDHGITGIQSGFTELDRITGGWQSPDLIIIAARPSMGKTVVGVCVAKEAAQKFKKPVGFFSLEMSKRQVMQRMIATDSEVDLDNIIRGTTNDYQINLIATKTNGLATVPLYIDDTPAISILELRAKARRMKHEHNIQMIVVDYLQLMRGDSTGNREQEVASISRGLKGIAKELNIPVIALSQLSRGVEGRGDKRPQLSDLRESGSIEQDADVVMFLYRAEYYKIEQDADGMPTAGVLEVITAKNRNGKTGSLYLKFIGKYAKIADLNGTNTGQESLKLERELVDFSTSKHFGNNGTDTPF